MRASRPGLRPAGKGKEHTTEDTTRGGATQHNPKKDAFRCTSTSNDGADQTRRDSSSFHSLGLVFNNSMVPTKHDAFRLLMIVFGGV